MFIGHFDVGFATRRFAPWSSEAVLRNAPLLADVLWPVFLLLGSEQVRIDPGNTRFTRFDLVSYPWSHSLLMAGTIAIWIGVVSHGMLDWITHRADMGLCNSIAGTIVVEFRMLAVGVWMYMGATRAKDRIGFYAFIGYIVLLMVLYIGDRFSVARGSVGEIVWPGIAAPFIVILSASWFDRHRCIRGELA